MNVGFLWCKEYNQPWTEFVRQPLYIVEAQLAYEHGRAKGHAKAMGAGDE